MFQRIIIGVVEHDGGRDAIKLAESLANRGARLTLVSVYPGAVSVWGGSNRIYEAVERQHAQDVLNRLRQTTGVDARLVAVAAASPGLGLHQAVEQERADLLVLGSSRHGLVGQVLLRNDTRDSLNGAPCAVAVAPAGYAGAAGTITRVGVGYNGSAESEDALTVARGLAAQLGASLSAMEAVEIPTCAFTAAGMPASGDLIEELVDEARRRVSGLPGVEPHAAYGLPAEELAHYGGSLDLLVVGSRGYGPSGRLVHGSTTSFLAGTARCPLLVLTRAAEQPSSGHHDDVESSAFDDQSTWVSSSITR